MNKAILAGRICRDPKVTYTQTQEPLCVARFTLAKERERSKRRRESNAIRGYVRSAKCVVPKPEPPREFKVGERYEYKPSDRMHSKWDEPVSVTVIGVYDYEILTQTEHGIKYGFNRKSAELDLKQIN